MANGSFITAMDKRKRLGNMLTVTSTDIGNGGVRMGNRSRLAHSQIVYRLELGRDSTKMDNFGTKANTKTAGKLVSGRLTTSLVVSNNRKPSSPSRSKSPDSWQN